MFAPSQSERMDLPEKSESIFCSGGLLEKVSNFRHRKEQAEMAYFCSQAFEGDTALLFEAGTGVGKTLAYLIPAIIFAKEHGRKLYVSTHTIALQEQIVKKDLPFIRNFFENTPSLKSYSDFKYAVLYGRGNYLCTTRLKKALAEKGDLFMNSEVAELDRIANWALTTKTGLKQELNPPPDEEVFSWVNAESSLCTPKKCTDCFYQNAKKEYALADVVVLNHSLVFSLMASEQGVDSQTKGILTCDDFFIFDEAHLIPQVAEENFGIELSDYSINKELKRIYNPRTKKGLLKKIKYASTYDIEYVMQALASTNDFFAKTRSVYLTGKDLARLSAEAWNDTKICDDLNALKQCLSVLSSKSTSETQKAEIDDCTKKVVGIKLALEDAIFLSTPKQVYWVEKSGKMGDITKVCSAPLDIAPILRKKIFSKGSGVVMTSATLSTNGTDIDSFAECVGGEIAQSGIVKSPFKYDENCRLMICKDAPIFEASKKMNAEFLADRIFRLSQKVNGGTLVLFTSYFELNACYEILCEKINDREIFAQGKYARSEILEKFKKSKNAILLGTDSFWTGVDIQGRALSLLIITKLPFSNPEHPLMAAKFESLTNQGLNPFAELSLPEAIVKFRQGFGRLIRSESDKGIVAILDSRILNKNYGKNFLSATSAKDYKTFDSKDLESKILLSLEEIGFDNNKE